MKRKLKVTSKIILNMGIAMVFLLFMVLILINSVGRTIDVDVETFLNQIQPNKNLLAEARIQLDGKMLAVNDEFGNLNRAFSS